MNLVSTIPPVSLMIDVIDGRCLAMKAALPRGLPGKTHVFATDAQTIAVNWTVKGRRASSAMVQS